MALSGQIANMTEKSLTFAPRLDYMMSMGGTGVSNINKYKG